MNIRDLAKELTTMSTLMVDKEKLPLEEISDGETAVSIEKVDIFEMDGQDVVVFTTKEYPDKFSFGGLVLLNLVSDLCEKTNMSIKQLNEELEKEPLEVIFSRDKTKKGRDITRIKVI